MDSSNGSIFTCTDWETISWDLYREQLKGCVIELDVPEQSGQPEMRDEPQVISYIYIFKLIHESEQLWNFFWVNKLFSLRFWTFVMFLWALKCHWDSLDWFFFGELFGSAQTESDNFFLLDNVSIVICPSWNKYRAENQVDAGSGGATFKVGGGGGSSNPY